MGVGLLAALTFFAQPTAPTGEANAWLIADCRLARVDLETMLPADETARFALLLRVPEGAGGRIDPASLRVFDPGFLLGGVRLTGALFRADGRLLSAQSDGSLPIVYRFNAAPGLASGAWRVGLRGNGRTAAGERSDHSYMGHCTLSQPGDAVAQFEGLGTAQ